MTAQTFAARTAATQDGAAARRPLTTVYSRDLDELRQISERMDASLERQRVLLARLEHGDPDTGPGAAKLRGEFSVLIGRIDRGDITRARDQALEIMRLLGLPA